MANNLTTTKANTDKVTQALATSDGSNLRPGMTLAAMLQTKTVKMRFEEVLGKRAAGFMSSIISATSLNKQLATADPLSVISAAAIAASLDLPINPSLGFAHIVPYKDKAQFQMGWKGFVQLAMRSGQYETINLAVVYDGQLKEYNPFTGEASFEATGKKSEAVAGYLLYFKLLNGYKKFFYMTRAEVEAHGKRYSQTFKKGFGVWVDNFDAMALKTVCKLGLSKYGILSIELQKAFTFDQAVVKEGDVPEYVDTTATPGESVEAPGPIGEDIPFGDPAPEA